MIRLPNDYARCSAVSNDEGEVVAPCNTCLRWLDRKTDNPRQPWIIPPRKGDGTCDSEIKDQAS